MKGMTKHEKTLWRNENAKLKRQCKKCGNLDRLLMRRISCEVLGICFPVGKKCEHFRKKRKPAIRKKVAIYVRNERGVPAHCDMCGNVIIRGYRIKTGVTSKGKPKYRYETNPNKPIALHWRIEKKRTQKPYVHSLCMTVSYRDKRLAKANGLTVPEIIERPNLLWSKTSSSSIFEEIGARS
jgi:hypothetical protein